MTNILLILPDARMRTRLQALLGSAGYVCRGDGEPEGLASTLEAFKPDLAILDEQLPADEIEAWLRVITGLSPNTRLMDISGSTERARRRVVSAHGYVEEPFSDQAFLVEVRRVLNARTSPEPALSPPG